MAFCTFFRGRFAFFEATNKRISASVISATFDGRVKKGTLQDMSEEIRESPRRMSFELQIFLSCQFTKGIF